jgi:hypothetical protein
VDTQPVIVRVMEGRGEASRRKKEKEGERRGKEEKWKKGK